MSTKANEPGLPFVPAGQATAFGPSVKILRPGAAWEAICGTPYALWCGDIEAMLEVLPHEPVFDLVVTSPPYNLGKAYEKRCALGEYVNWQARIIDHIIPRIRPTGSICWQVGNFVENGQIAPLDIELAPIFKRHGIALRNRIVWHFGHGLHNRRRFSGRYEVILWYTKSDDYTFNLDAVRIPAKYPGKRHFKGPKIGQLSSNPLGKNPEDVWEIPNVKSNHIEKTDHPCQFPGRAGRKAHSRPVDAGLSRLRRNRRHRLSCPLSRDSDNAE